MVAPASPAASTQLRAHARVGGPASRVSRPVPSRPCAAVGHQGSCGQAPLLVHTASSAAHQHAGCLHTGDFLYVPGSTVALLGCGVRSARRRRCSALSATSGAGQSNAAGAANVVPTDAPQSQASGELAPGLQPPSAGGPEPGGDGGGQEQQQQQQQQPQSIEPVLLLRLRAQAWLDSVDQTGVWTVVSSLLAFSLFLLETMNEERFGGWDVLFRDDLPWYYGLSMSTLSYVEGVTNTVFIAEFGLRAWIAGFSLRFFTNPYNLVDLASASPPLLALAGADPRALRLLRVCRVLRLLRLLDREPDSVLFGVLRTDDSGTQLLGVAAEFVCIFAIAAGVIYDLELGSNDNVHNLSDTLYWAFLTLTGIGQPFEVVTPAGKVATVIAVLVALITIPGQLAKLATVSMSQNMNLLEYMNDEERQAFIASGGKVAPRTAEQAAAAQARARGAPQNLGLMRSTASGAASRMMAQVSISPMQRGGGGGGAFNMGQYQQQQQPQAAEAASGAGEATPAPIAAVSPAASKPKRVGGAVGGSFRRTLVVPRRCGNAAKGTCAMDEHPLDAAYCSNCGAPLLEPLADARGD